MLNLRSQTPQRKAKTYSAEISVTSDNDNYLLKYHDGYYTNGFYINYSRVTHHRLRRASKEIIKISLGQKIFNPTSYKVTDYSEMDRPFAGYLFGGVSRTRFYGVNNLLQLGAEIGTIGKASGAEAVQNSYHRMIHIYSVPGWYAQLHDEPGLNLHLTAAQLLDNSNDRLPTIDFTTIEKIKIGNTFTNGSFSLLLRLGKKGRTIETNSWGSKIESGEPIVTNQPEFFFFFQPELIYQLYNATVEGGMFIKDKGPVTGEIMPWVYQHRLGLQASVQKFSVSVGASYRTKEAKKMKKNERFGSITLALRFN